MTIYDIPHFKFSSYVKFFSLFFLKSINKLLMNESTNFLYMYKQDFTFFNPYLIKFFNGYFLRICTLLVLRNLITNDFQISIRFPKIFLFFPMKHYRK